MEGKKSSSDEVSAQLVEEEDEDGEDESEDVGNPDGSSGANEAGWSRAAGRKFTSYC